jgi:hypothetical protein
MARWQRWTTYLALAACATTGLVWFLELDVWDATPSTARPWWIAHGVTAVFAALVIGGAIAQHVIVTWRAARGRWTGAINAAMLAALLLTALYLMYGAEVGHDLAHWVHAIVGIVAVFAFVGHVLWGRTRIPRIARRGERPGRAA